MLDVSKVKMEVYRSQCQTKRRPMELGGILNWRPWDNKRSRGRPQMRWEDDLRNGKDWGRPMSKDGQKKAKQIDGWAKFRQTQKN